MSRRTYFTLTGTKYYLRNSFLKPGMEEKENLAFREGIGAALTDLI